MSIIDSKIVGPIGVAKDFSSPFIFLLFYFWESFIQLVDVFGVTDGGPKSIMKGLEILDIHDWIWRWLRNLIA